MRLEADGEGSTDGTYRGVAGFDVKGADFIFFYREEGFTTYQSDAAFLRRINFFDLGISFESGYAPVGEAAGDG